jgi:TolB-like protein
MHSRPRLVRRWLRGLPLLALAAVAGIVWAARPNDPQPARSIVVLPFVNLSPNEDNEYFADGLTEDVITRLAAVPGLKVISRTSAMHYKGSGKPLRQIAAELNVAQVLEGSVRRSDRSVRVTAQLIDAATDEHRWAETYESSVQTSFRVQEEIARAVARALEVEVPERARRQLVRRGTSNPMPTSSTSGAVFSGKRARETVTSRRSDSITALSSLTRHMRMRTPVSRMPTSRRISSTYSVSRNRSRMRA